MIEILLACYNSEKYIARQLDSLFEQTCGDFFITVRDDGSRDKTLDIIEEYRQKYPDRIRLLSDGEKNLGACKNFARLLANATGDYVMLCDHDDKWLPGKIETALGAVKKAENGGKTPVLVHTDLIPADEKLLPISQSFAALSGLRPEKNRLCDYLVQNNVTGCTVMMNAALTELLREIPDGALMHDWWAALVASTFGRVVYVPKAEILYCQHGDNTVGAADSSSREYVENRAKTAGERLYATYIQAQAFLDKFGGRLSPEQKRLVGEYADCARKGKLYRIRTVLKNGTKKHGAVKFLAQLLYC